MISDYHSRIFTRFEILDRIMLPIALKGIPIATILRIFSILLLGFFALNSYDNWDETYIRNVHIIIFISALYTFLIYVDDSRHFFNIFFMYGGVIAIIANIFVIANIGHSSDGMGREEVIMTADMFSLFLLSFSLISVKDKYFYANYLRYSRIPNNQERIFALTKSLKFGEGYLFDNEISYIISDIAYLYEKEGYTVMSNRSKKLENAYKQYYELFKSVTTRYNKAWTFSPEFENAKELVDYAEDIQNQSEDI